MTNHQTHKASGVDWIESIPADWEIIKPKYKLNRVTRPIDDDDEVITCFRDGIVTLRKNRREEGFTNSIQEHGYQQIRPGDLVVHEMDGFAGAIGISDSKGKSTPVYTVIEPDGRADLGYVAYLLREMSRSGKIESLARSIRERTTDFRWNMWSVINFPFPPVEEQKLISRYLDKKTSQIDSLINKIEKKIELLKEQRTSLINQHVTKGLDPNVEMKASGVEWIGEIPKHWGISKIKYIAQLENGSTPKSDIQEYWNGPIKWFTPTDFKHKDEFGCIRNSARSITENGFNNSGCSLINSTSLLMTTRAPVGNLAKIDGPFTFNQGCKSLTPTFINLDYLYFFLLTKSEPLNVLSNGTTFKELPTEKLLNFELPVPPMSEQVQIAEVLTGDTIKNQKLISLLESKISTILEYRKSLISSAVTGKVKVTEEMV